MAMRSKGKLAARRLGSKMWSRAMVWKCALCVQRSTCNGIIFPETFSRALVAVHILADFGLFLSGPQAAHAFTNPEEARRTSQLD